MSSHLQNVSVLTCGNWLRQVLQWLWVVKKWRDAANSVTKHWAVAAGSGREPESLQQNPQIRKVGREETIWRKLRFLQVEHFSAPNVCDSSWESRRDSPNNWRCLGVPQTRIRYYYFTRWRLFRVWISNVSELLRWFEACVPGFKTEICQGSFLRNSNYQRSKKKIADRRGKSGWENWEGARGSSSLRYSCKQLLALIFSNVEAFIKNQQISNSNGLYLQNSYISNKFEWVISEYKGILHCEWYNYEKFPDEFLEVLLCEPFFTRRKKMLSRPDGFTLYCKLRVEIFSTSQMPYPIMKIRLFLIRTRPKVYMVSDKPTVSLGIVGCSFYTRPIALKDPYHRKRMGILAYTSEKFNYRDTLAKTFIKLARQNQFIQENSSNKPPVGPLTIAMNTNSAFTGF